MKSSPAALLGIVFCAGAATAQTIERIRPADPYLNCAQLQGEIASMDKVLAETIADAERIKQARVRRDYLINATLIRSCTAPDSDAGAPPSAR